MQNEEGIGSEDLNYFAALTERRFIYATGRIRWNLRKTKSPRKKALFDQVTSILHNVLKAYLQDFVERYRALS